MSAPLFSGLAKFVRNCGRIAWYWFPRENSMPRKRTADTPPFNPSVLRWARDRAGLSPSEAARKLSVPEERILDWEDEAGDFVPTVRQARNLAAFYGRSFLEFFLEAPPSEPERTLIPDFRLYRGAEPAGDTRELLEAQLWAETQRDNAVDLYSELGDDVPRFPETLFTTDEANVETIASRVREAIHFPITAQIGLNSTERKGIPSVIRTKIESLGVLTLRRSDLKRYGVRGFCIASFPLPVIVFTMESPNAQSFTLAHELAHVLLRQSAISGSIPREGGDAAIRKIEGWCNKFAAAFLIPRRTLLEKYPKPVARRNSIGDDEIASLAAYFGVSEHAMLVRLVELEYVRASFYWDIKLPLYSQEERDFRQFARPQFYGTRYSNALGPLYTALVIEAWNAGRITNHNAAEFMGIKNLAHLHDIREDFGT